MLRIKYLRISQFTERRSGIFQLSFVGSGLEKSSPRPPHSQARRATFARARLPAIPQAGSAMGGKHVNVVEIPRMDSGGEPPAGQITAQRAAWSKPSLRRLALSQAEVGAFPLIDLEGSS